jgi:MFS family permease
MNKPRLWTKDFVIIALLNFFVGLNFYLLMVITSGFAMESFHSSPSEAGIAVGMFVIGALFARLFSGKWIERIGRKRMLYAGLTLSLTMTLLYSAANGIVFLVGVRLFHGVALGMATTATGTIVASIIPKQRTGEGIGYYMLGVTLGTAIGPFLGMFILGQHGSFGTVFGVCVVVAVLNSASALFISVPEITLTKGQIEATKGFSFESFFETRAIPISIVCGAIYLSYSSVLSFLTAFSKEAHLTGAASLFFVVYAGAVVLSRPYAGRLFDSRGANSIMYPAIIVFAIGMIILSRAHHGYTLLIAAAFVGVGSGAVQSVSQAVTVKVTPPHRLGLANSTLFICMDIGLGIGPFTFGLFVPFAGYRGVYVGAATVAFICTLLYHMLHGKRAAIGKAQFSPTY